MGNRLSVFQIVLPPVRERIEDLEQLVSVFIDEFNAHSNQRIKRIGERKLRQMSRYHWPGNIRELRNVIERAVLLSEGGTLANFLRPRACQRSSTCMANTCQPCGGC